MYDMHVCVQVCACTCKCVYTVYVHVQACVCVCACVCTSYNQLEEKPVLRQYCLVPQNNAIFCYSTNDEALCEVLSKNKLIVKNGKQLLLGKCRV